MALQTLSPWACQPEQSRGRRYPEDAAPTRTEHQRDRDRIVHSSAFRRLVYKTQVFVNHEGDLFRTRLTHSLEVAQLGRSIARPLGLNEDLVEAICLAHDLGHTPFGHAGQDELNACMQAWGGFEHNLQSLRVVDALEERYPQYDGLNLTFETREGILKHCSRANALRLEAQEPGGVAARFLSGRQTSLEGQLANLADAIAYNAHDVDDGVRSGLITLEQLQAVPLFAHFHAQTLAAYPQLAQASEQRRLLYETIRRMLSAQVYDVIDTTRAQIAQSGVAHVDDVRAQGQRLVAFSAGMQAQSQALKHFLFHQLYRHDQVMQTMDAARQVVRELFAAYLQQPAMMKPRFAQRALQADQEAVKARAVADFVAGMTDRYASREHERITGRQLLG
ncbi:deoxyguanosinetriphosphate triphosphohydrolase [Comamonas aquatica]|uniref:deoxyguanosinetriphosphate triphosphohydrolase n=1 Tax=Comamonas aquatica TaxID=225991 RepID=UPI0022DDDC0F|nr:deoxyguanosinetriphosphate triphosphohydrolase [Comamonas aquatica]MDH1378804.1 deoxyguanosinetriphosphate triphosphohydrolase [Comamonas aquatica]MDH1638734.1 deoxyguanosinetriphosphate triphosphohydrolase [Comamonas aquatica]MDH1903399.1 deoxyguanosinetriphosphate triphosphohydrolase [Comamonas aquatica]WBM42517.1 deoxyguanosinetriphosphate triphosphohydrolase [Comamonas aquatica]